VIDRQQMDGVTCDHISFESDPAFVRGLFPGVEVTGSTYVATEIWVDPQTRTVKHFRIDATDLENRKLGVFDCHVEGTVTTSPAALQINLPM
jgi:hypothetical protein